MPLSGVWVVVDQHELRSEVPAALRGLGVDVEVVSLAVADYAVGVGVLVERKTAGDLHRSIARRRLWAQLNALRGAAHAPYLLVEGDVDDGPIGEHGIRGALLGVIESGVSVLRSSTPLDSALWIARLAARAQRVRSSRAVTYPPRRPRRTPAEAAEVALTAIPTISPRAARALLDRFGSVAAVAAASVKDLRAVDGIGRKRAAEIAAALHGGEISVQVGRRAVGAPLELHDSGDRSASRET